ncbi:hypothetical protein E3Q08_03240 [Wallemia mellicola]|nr:hypothetical protein E3Q21_03260 [Wallemia mellicola]TIC21772.1 hypothetical protein E3Q12_03162 [Wallemia mellicola]TIC33794.1 hypothetical protein E3Q09_03286 [Wallemia mellicola]TIC39135.1 hypothetical protein E3Q07_03320 [Wallemia mellicola]TIC41546.1 hypothetical protein E3Q08_03240 [Wallemia mellicola]
MDIDRDEPAVPLYRANPGVDLPQTQGYEDIHINDTSTSIDLLFIMDSTGSMGSYLDNATKNVIEICQTIIQSEKLQGEHALRLGLISYRDSKPQDYTYETKNFGFTHDYDQMRENLKSLYASGGGDGPEAVTIAMKEAVENMPWRANASKMAVLVADAPPHGIGEYGDGFPEGSPCGNDPLQLARVMASHSITLFVVACEPALSGYQYSTDFFKALADLTGGMMIPLVSASLLAQVIIGSALEQMDIERLIKEVGSAVAERVHGQNENVDDVARALHETLMLRNESTKRIYVENIYRESEEADYNYNVWRNIANIQDAKGVVKRVPGSRFTDKYLSMRYASPPSYSYTTGAPALPARPGASSTSESSRKPLSSFAAFSAGPQLHNTSIMSTPVGASTTSAAFSGPRTSTRNEDMMDDDSDDEKLIDQQLGEEDDVMQPDEGVQFRQGAITYDQARRITTASAWRSAMAYR